MALSIAERNHEYRAGLYDQLDRERKTLANYHRALRTAKRGNMPTHTIECQLREQYQIVERLERRIRDASNHA